MTSPYGLHPGSRGHIPLPGAFLRNEHWTILSRDMGKIVKIDPERDRENQEEPLLTRHTKYGPLL